MEQGGKPPFEKLIKGFPRKILEQQCTEPAEDSKHVLVFVSKNSSVTPRYLGRSLDLTEADISSILHAHGELDEQRYQVLLKWINKHGNEATNLYLTRALYENDDLPTLRNVLQIVTMTPDSSLRDIPVPPMSLYLGESTSLPSSRTHTPLNLGRFPGMITPVQDHGGSTHLLTGPSHLTKYAVEMLVTRSQSVSREDSNESQTPSVSTPLSVRLGCIEVDGAASTPLSGKSHSGSVGSEGSDLSSSFSESCSECACPRSSYDPRCTHPLGHQLQHKLENLMKQHCQRAASLTVENVTLQSQVVQRQVVLEHRTRELVEAYNVSGDMHKQNELLKSELEISRETVRLVWDALEKFKDRASQDLAPLQEQYQQLESDCAHSNSDCESLEFLKSQLESLQHQKVELDSELDRTASLYHGALHELESFKRGKGHQLQAQVDHAHKEMETLMSRVEQLESENRRQKKEIQFLAAQLKAERERKNPSHLHKPHLGLIQRSLSDSYGGSLYTPQTECTSLQNATCSQETPQKSQSVDGGSSNIQPHLSQRQEGDIDVDDYVHDTHPNTSRVCMWMKSATQVVNHFESCSQNLTSNIENFSTKLQAYSRRKSQQHKV